MIKSKNINIKIAPDLLKMIDDCLEKVNQDPTREATKTSIITDALIAFVNKNKK